MTKAEQIAHNNLKAKLEKYKARIDIIEQEKEELEQENDKLEKKNMELSKIASEKCNELYDEIAKLNEKMTEADAKKKEDAKTIKKLKKTIDELNAVIVDLKSNKIKDSTNSGKPSSTNGYKRVIQNNREKSDKKKGGQIGRKGRTLEEEKNPTKIENVYGKEECECGGKIIYTCEYIKKQVIDILNEVEKIEYRYYKGKCEKCGKEYIAPIPKEQANPVQYSMKVRNSVPLIRNMCNISVETTQKLFKTMFKGLDISIGWIHKQDKALSKKCKGVVEDMKEHLEQTPVAHSDETSVKIEEKLGCCLCFSDDKAVVYDMFKSKSEESFNEFEIYKKYRGILVHDHNKTYYKYLAMSHAECNVHILRYLKGVIDLTERKGAKELREFLRNIYKEKLEAMEKNEEKLTEERVGKIEEEYIEIIEKWEKEYNEEVAGMERIPQALKDEKNLFTRLGKYKEEHLRFVKDFRVPFSNNEAERNLRKIKIKVNVSQRFGKLECAKEYAIIKSVIETAKKQKKDIFEVFSKIAAGDYKVFELNLKANTEKLG